MFTPKEISVNHLPSLAKLFRLSLVVIFFVIILAGPVSASSGLPQEQTPPLTLDAFLKWLIGGGGSIIAVSWIFERMRWFQALTSQAKQYTIFGAAVVVGCGALAVITYAPAATLSAIAPYFLIIASIFTTVFIAETFHKADKAG